MKLLLESAAQATNCKLILVDADREGKETVERQEGEEGEEGEEGKEGKEV